MNGCHDNNRKSKTAEGDRGNASIAGDTSDTSNTSASTNTSGAKYNWHNNIQLVNKYRSG